ncbi:putative gmp synthase [Rosellinia necatrix]|uniref:Putative gmp synthase n=1 Tax=Rosellinia necatrix TaxID=77044 RepID=A0A1W2TEJ9_ROSNE|nr:putative gmp synthase [Rosellinia necatrix]
MSSGWKDKVKNSWQPEKAKSALKSQVKGLVGQGETSAPRESHVAAPRSTLRDPSSFGPPPKHVAAYGPAAPQGSSRAVIPVPGQTQDAAQSYRAQAAEEELPAEPRPYRVDTTGLSTSHLPPPPTRRGADGRHAQSPPIHTPTPKQTPPAVAMTKPKPPPPSLPPRLPPRSGNSTPSPTLVGEQAAIPGRLNQGAVSRLGAVGISVPGLGIGGTRTPPPPGARPSPTQAPGNSQVDELQARFTRMGTASPHQAGDNSIVADGAGQQPAIQALGKKKPPPPPIPKKPSLSSTRESDTPPPVPLATRPRFD